MATTQHTHDSTASMGAGLLFGVGAVALGVFSASRPLVGVAVYAVAATGSLALWYRFGGFADDDGGAVSPADSTLALLGMASAVVFPALVAADGLGYFAWSGFTAGVAFGVAGLFAVFGVVSLAYLVRARKQ